MTAVIEARGLVRHYAASRGAFRPPATLKALAGVSFSLEAGRTLAVVGELGSGKSTLARLLTLIEKPTAGALLIDGEDVAHADRERRRRLRREIQMVFQNPFGSLNPRQTIGKALEEPLLVNTNMSAAERKAAALAIMQKVGLRVEYYHRYPHMFSGGQRQRIAIARALVLRPKILVLDEPVSALDVSIRAQVLNLLAGLQEEFGLAYVFVSHDLSVVRHIADEVMVIYLGHAGRDGLARGDFPAPAASLHSRAPVGDAGRGSWGEAGAHSLDRGAAVADRAAARLPLQPALSARLRPLPAREAAGRAEAGTGRRLFRSRGVEMSDERLVLPPDGRQSETAAMIARGVRRLLRARGFSSVTELPLVDGRRADVVAVNSDGDVLIVEIKSSAADLRADRKWRDYATFCDRLYFAVSEATPADIVPFEAGLIVADAFGAEILREADFRRMASASRRAVLLRFARAAADRLHHLADPGGAPDF